MKARYWRGPGFTLIELLIVMGIIGILVALLFPAVRVAREAAAKIEAATAVKSIETAIKNFYSEYGRMPMQTSTTSDQEYSSSGTYSYTTLIATLRANNTTYNPKRTAYLDVKDAKLSNGVYLDPWDQPYRVFADFNGDNNTDITTAYGISVKGRLTAVWSKGPDQGDTQPTNRVDDITSWGN